jgi:S-adenosylmethionine-dependent methyltransferase
MAQAHGSSLVDLSASTMDRKQIVKSVLRSRLASQDFRRNQRNLSKDQLNLLAEALQKHYFTDPMYYPDAPEAYLSTSAGRKDLADNLTARLEEFRALVAPWLNSIFALRGSRIIEVGCGTGSSSVSLAEQGADIVGIDVSDRALEVARVRFDLYGLKGNFIVANASDVGKIAAGGNVDAVIFFAVMEHMTWEERATSLKAAWNLLQSGRHLIIIETPNRLWHTDTHTSFDPFFYWLPDELAIPYSRFTRRKTYNEIFRNAVQDDETRVRFARWGRGVSYHDLVLSLGIPADEIQIISSLQLYLRKHSPEHVIRWIKSWRYERLLKKLAPGVDPGFFCEDLYVALRKP